MHFEVLANVLPVEIVSNLLDKVEDFFEEEEEEMAVRIFELCRLGIGNWARLDEQGEYEAIDAISENISDCISIIILNNIVRLFRDPPDSIQSRKPMTHILADNPKVTYEDHVLLVGEDLATAIKEYDAEYELNKYLKRKVSKFLLRKNRNDKYTIEKDIVKFMKDLGEVYIDYAGFMFCDFDDRRLILYTRSDVDEYDWV